MTDLNRRQFVSRSGAALAALGLAATGSSRLLAEALGASGDLTPERAETYKALVVAVAGEGGGRKVDAEAAYADFEKWFAAQSESARGTALLVLDRIESGPDTRFSKRRPDRNAEFLGSWKSAKPRHERENDAALLRRMEKGPGSGGSVKEARRRFDDYLLERRAQILARQKEIKDSLGEHVLDLDGVTGLPRWRPDLDGETPVSHPIDEDSDEFRRRATALAAEQLALVPFPHRNPDRAAA